MSEDFKDWKELGNDIKAIRSELFDVFEKARKLTKSKRALSKLVKAINFVDEFRSCGEDEMWRVCKVRMHIAEHDWIGVFYKEENE